MSLDFCLMETKRVDVCDANTTHNHTKHAHAIGIYKHLWRPEELGIKKAHEMISPLQGAINELRVNPEKYRQYDNSEGWGTVEYFLEFMEKVLCACEEHPDADVEVWR